MLGNDGHGPWLLVLGRFLTDGETEGVMNLDDGGLMKAGRPAEVPVGIRVRKTVLLDSVLGEGTLEIAGWKSGVKLKAEIVNTSHQDMKLVSEGMRPLRFVTRSVTDYQLPKVDVV